MTGGTGVSREQKVQVALAHAAAETEGDLEATLATLDPAPVYELQPIGLEIRGMDGARAYYEYFFANFMPLVEGFELRSEWENDEGLGQEYVMQLRDKESGAVHSEPIIGILLFGETGLSGERLYANESLFKIMFGPVYDRAVPVGSP
jgi:hypothetical protein